MSPSFNVFTRKIPSISLLKKRKVQRLDTFVFCLYRVVYSSDNFFFFIDKAPKFASLKLK
nr:MAG TPA: hypothetical protein [Caudoviricetes sp.]DAQ02467.1 MAG TPA: hypothetical protein [Caudoviricetes sp.]